MATFVRLLARRQFATTSICRREVEMVSNEYINKVRREKSRFSETSAFYGPGGGARAAANDDMAVPFYIASYYDSMRFQYIRGAAVFGSVILLGVYIACFRQPTDIDELWSYDMRLVYIVAKKKVLREQIEQAQKAGRSSVQLETDLINLEVQEEKIRAAEEKKMKLKQQTKTSAALIKPS